MLKALLGSCGLNESERVVFESLVEHGFSLASVIARRTELKRPNVYACLENLLHYGLINKQKRSGVTYYGSLPLDMIAKVIENEARRKFNETQQAAQMLQAELNQRAKRQNKAFQNFEISSVESKAGLYEVLKSALMGGDFDAFFNPQVEFQSKEIQEATLEFLAETAKTKPHIRDIIVAGPMANWYMKKIKNPNHQVKTIPTDKKILSDMIMIEGAVYLMQFSPQREVGIRIVEPDFYESMKTVFEIMWENLND
ncbi:MAG: helix-turn-helix domain-containing protein [bacterium]|nr:helix-turn-helix domain-containing protein [bacterium]